MAKSERKKLNRAEERDLDIEIGFLARLAQRAPDYVDALELLGENYTRRGRFKDGLQVDLQLVTLRPENPLVHYNLGCSYSLTDQPEKAFKALNKAIDCGYRDFHWLSRDPDLATFREHPLYRKLRTRVRTMRVPVE